ncbi:hypothetical protein LCGC14_1946970 [marine sediment metagenome]|uniref:Uncharacterized protein n=1 Tax=marine sediment metagenome TaxID=412755 RepID=A0A0F9G715_9ZZZZ
MERVRRMKMKKLLICIVLLVSSCTKMEIELKPPGYVFKCPECGSKMTLAVDEDLSCLGK